MKNIPYVNRLSVVVLISCLFFLPNFLKAETFVQDQADSLVSGAELVVLHDEYQTLQFLRFEDGFEPETGDVNLWLENTLQTFNEGVTFVLQSKEDDNLGHVHYKFAQKLNDIAVEYAVVSVHENDGKIYAVSGEYYPVSSSVVSTTGFSKEQAIAQSRELFVNAAIDAQSLSIKYLGEIYIQREGQEMTLCHKIDAHGTDPKPKRSFIYFSQQDGSIIFEEDRIIHTNSTGTAHTKYNGTVSITTDSLSPTNYVLTESGPRTITTKNLNNGTSYFSATNYTDTDNIWDADSVALDAHYGAEKTHEYFSSTYGLNSYDNAGASINSYVHYGSNYVNAFWDGTQMTYGDGDGVNYGPLTAIDVVAHEITHAVTQNSANLVYSNESGALNESFSDIFAVVIEHFANPSAGNFTMGEQFVLGNNLPFRDFTNPNSLNDPDTYQGNFWDFVNQEVHNNGTPHTYWFYLLCNGGTGVNDNSATYSVNSIGMTDAAAIAYRALTVYLSANSNYAASRVATIQSAIDLFGSCSQQEIQVTNAWHAVGVGGVYSNAITASFTANNTTFCTIPASVAFTNTSNSATSYLWDFGDGTTDTTTSPTHNYVAAGTYTVTLIANGATICGGADTITLNNYITVSNGGGPISAACSPSTINYCCGNGIINFQLGSINSSSNNASEGYKDFTCAQSTTVTTGSNYQYSIDIGGTNIQNYKIFVDFNNNGSFSATEEVVSALSVAGGTHTGIFSFPATAVLGSPLRMRVISYAGTSFTNACTSPNNGQVEDYTVTIVAPTSPPIADFTTANFTVTTGATVPLQDLSTNGPTSWTWTIAGGTPSTSSGQNPSTVFSSPGIYAVKLVASNSFGSDSITKNITAVSTFTMCSDDSSTSSSGTLYDSGGPTGSYSNGENCYFTISPGACTDSIVLNFTAFSTESCCDYLRVYNGPTTSSPLLYQGQGSSIPANITGTNDKMLLYFHSDGSVIGTGFALNWTSHQQAAVAPTANFTFTPNNIPVLDTVTFTDASSANTTAWNWDFGDGGVSNLQNPIHPYSLPGTYQVTLIVESCNAFDTLTQSVIVQASPTVMYNPTSFNISLGCNDTVDVSLLISNINGGTLNWNTAGLGIGGNNMLAWMYGVDSVGEYVNMMNALNQHFTNYTLSTTNTTSPSVMQGLLANKKVLLIPEMEQGVTSAVTPFTSVIQNYVSNGGTVIVCGNQTSYGPNTAVNIGLFSGSYVTDAQSATLNVVNSTTPLTDSLPSSFSGINAVYVYNLTNANKVKAIDYNGNDVVSYMPYGQGKVIFIAHDYYTVNTEASQIIGNAVRWGMQGSSFTSGNLQVNPTSGSLTSGNTDTVSIQVNSTGLTGGLDTLYLIVNTNDTSSLQDTIPFYLTLSTLPCVSFGYNITSPCTGTVFFHDSTLNNPTAWSWDFGDGNSSSLQNPTHSYIASGTYQVQLIATNSSGSDTLIRTIVVNSVHGPIGINCAPVSTNPNTSYGIQNVNFGNINSTTSNSTEGYLDLTCTDTTSLTVGSQYSLSITTFNNFDRVNVWLDTNNDGQLSNTELIATFNTTGNTLRQALISIPNISALNTPLRMRVGSGSSIPGTACTTPYVGQMEDYTVYIVAPTAAPVVDFTTASFTVATGNSITLNDISTNGPSAWSWTIPGGVPTSSSVQNPNTTFATPGVYPVKLVASNSFGSDSITKNITVVTSHVMCTDDSSTASNGILFDSGGPTGNYSNGENCSFLITPGTCTDSIKIHFSSFHLESCCDYVRVYDGPTISSPLLFIGNGTSIPADITGSSDKMLIRFTSDGSGVYPGFELDWISYQQTATAPTAGFTFTPNNLPVLDTVFFTDASSANTTSWNWAFGDGNFSSMQNPSHPYALPGTYQVTLIAESCNAYDTLVQTVTVQSSPTVSYNPTSFNVSLGCNDTVDVNLLISNTNGGTLNWNTTNSSNGSELLVWMYGVDSNLTVVNSINGINQYAPGYNITYTSTTTPSVLQAALQNKSVVLLPTNFYGNTSVLSAMSSTLQAFVQNGGMLITCGDFSLQASMNLGLFTGSYQGFASSGNMSVINTSTPVTNNVPTTFSTTNYTARYNITNTNKVKLVEYNTEDIVTYMPYGQGKAVFIGFDYRTTNNDYERILANTVTWGMQTSANSGNVQVSPTSGSLTSGNTDTVNIQISSVGLSGGLDTMYVIVNTNDTSSLIDTIPIYATISSLPCANFGFDVSSSCTGSVIFTDSSSNNPTSWSWDFGDGNSSSLQNPIHSYQAANVYQVTLITVNGSGTDTVSKQVTINSVHGPLGVNCSPVTTSSNSGYGIQSVMLGNINSTTSNSTEGYLDLTCTDTTSLTAGSQYLLTVNTFNIQDKVKVWIDTNNNGQLDNNEEFVAWNSGTTTMNQVVLTIPTANIVMNTPLRMRVMSGYYTTSSSCSVQTYGQAEDYTVKFVQSAAPPVVDFTTASFTVATGSNITLNDISTNGPTAWSYTIPGGTPSSSTAQNPNVTFATAGVYPVKLVASNSFGSDSITKNITVVTNHIMCSDDSSTASSGILFDSGGPTGNYSNGENCSFLITPGACTDSIQLSFASFNTESCCDYIRIYDGATTGSPLLLQAQGTAIPANVTGTSDKMLIFFHTDGSVVRSGFEINWTSYQQTATAPTAGFTFTPNNLPVLDTVFFTDASSANTTSWNWAFGDGNFSSMQNPSHPYALPGTYQVTLIAESCNAYDTLVQTVTVQSSPTVSYNPTSFNVSLGCNDTVDVNLLISNTNGGTLNWNTTNSSNGSELLVWMYGVDSNLTVVNSINGINQYAPGYNITYTSTTTPSVLQAALQNKSVVLLPTNFYGNTSVLSAMSSTLQAFVQNGGMLITCGDFSLQASMNLGLFTGSYQGFASSGNMSVINTSTPVTNNVPTTFSTTNYTARYNITNTNKVKLVEYNTEDIVTYMPYGQGKAVFIGFDYRTTNNDYERILANTVTWGMQTSANSGNVQVSPTSGSLTSGNTDTVNIQISSVGLSGGLDTMYVIVNTNDTSSLIDTIPIYATISSLPCVEFGHEITNLCSGQVQFMDSSLNNPTSWSWDFGDGNSSTVQNPLHTYAAPGTYQVKLISTNSSGSDSLTKTVTLNFITSPVTSTCNMPTAQSCCGYGMVEFEIGNIHSYTGSDTEGYKDLTCQFFDYVNKGASYPFTITTANTGSQYFSMYLDQNNDGAFSAAEVLFNNVFNNGTYSGTITIPATGVTTNTGLRLRVVASDYTHTLCSSIGYGQAEDYTLIVLDSLPNADFVATPTTAYVNQSIQFTDLTTSNPNSWNWNLPGANNTNPTVQNPSVSYPVAGTYDATLIASNAVGADTMLKPNYITIQNLPNISFTHMNVDCEGRVDFNATLPVPFTNVRWYWGDGDSLSSNGNTATHVYLTGGTYSVMLVAYSTYGNDTITIPINVSIWYPTISHSGVIAIGNPISFSVNSASTISSYLWDFGNSATSSLGNPSTTYNTAGVFYISATVEDSNQCQKTIYDTISIIPDVVVDYGLATNIKVYPNPFDDKVVLEFTDLGIVNELDITIRNASGQTVHKKQLEKVDLTNHKITVRTSQFSIGTYFITIEVDDALYHLKLLKANKY